MWQTLAMAMAVATCGDDLNAHSPPVTQCAMDRSEIEAAAREYTREQRLEAEVIAVDKYENEWIVTFRSHTQSPSKPGGGGGFTVTLDNCGKPLGLKKGL